MNNLISAVFGRFEWLMTALLSAVLLPLVALLPLPLPLPVLFCVAVLLITCCGRFSFTAIKLQVQKLE